MSHTRCLAQDKLDDGKYAFCDRWTDAHPAGEHVDGEHRWPACSQYCLRDHVHGRYRLHVGHATGPATLAGRTPKPDRPRRGGRVPCKICFEPAELEHGQCKDRKACAERAPQLDLGI